MASLDSSPPVDRPLPAHQTKSLAEIAYPLWPQQHTVTIAQNNNLSDSTGRTVWLGAQVLSVYLAHILANERPFKKDGQRKRVIELGAGCGLLSLAMHNLGYDVLSTDIPAITSTLLQANLGRNRSTARDAPALSARALDWFSPPDEWDFTQPSVTPPFDRPSSRSHEEGPSLCPPFDLILTSDTAYDRTLTTPLLRTLSALSELSSTRTPPPVFLALEVRDPGVIDAFLAEARDDWGFKAVRVADERIARLVGEEGLGWEEADWEGVQVWKLVLGKKSRKARGAPVASELVEGEGAE